MTKWILAGLLAFGLQVGAAAQVNTQADNLDYVVDGIALGAKVTFNTNVLRKFQCNPTSQFAGFTWCQRQRSEMGPNGPFASSNSILRDASGTAVYVNRYIEPAVFGAGDIESQIERLSHRYGPARVQRLGPVDGRPAAVIALYGNIQLELLNDAQIAGIKLGRHAQGFIPIDFLGDFQKSAELGLPLFRISGHDGYIWSASYDANGRGTLRFLAANAQAFDPNAVWSNPSVGLPLTGFASDPSVPKPATNETKNYPPPQHSDRSEQADVDESARLASIEAAANRRAAEIVAEAKNSAEIAEQGRQQAEAGQKQAEKVVVEKDAARQSADELRMKAEPSLADRNAVKQVTDQNRSKSELTWTEQAPERPRSGFSVWPVLLAILIVGILIAVFQRTYKGKRPQHLSEAAGRPTTTTYTQDSKIILPEVEASVLSPAAGTASPSEADSIAAITNVIDQIASLAALHRSGTLNQDEFDRLKAKLMAGQPKPRSAA